MKVLIVGGTSSLGSALKPVLSEFYTVITAGRQKCDIIIDLKDSINKFILPSDIDTIIHTAASFGGNSADEILQTENINVLGTLKLCQAAVQANVKHFILISSIYVCLKENSENYNIYTLSKKHSEEVVRLYCSSNSMKLTILRPSPIYGIGGNFKLHHPFLYLMLDKAKKGEDITLYGSNDPLRNYIYIDDLTKIILKIIQKRVEGTYSCAHTEDVTYSRIAKAAFAAFNSSASVHFLKDKADIPDNIFEKDHSLYEKIGFYPEVSIEEGIKKIALS